MDSEDSESTVPPESSTTAGEDKAAAENKADSLHSLPEEMVNFCGFPS